MAEPEAEDVGEGWGVFAAGAYSDAVDGHGGLAVFVGEGGDQGRAVGVVSSPTLAWKGRSGATGALAAAMISRVAGAGLL